MTARVPIHYMTEDGLRVDGTAAAEMHSDHEAVVRDHRTIDGDPLPVGFTTLAIEVGAKCPEFLPTVCLIWKADLRAAIGWVES